MVMMSGSEAGSRIAEGILIPKSLHRFMECLKASEDGSVNTFASLDSEFRRESAACVGVTSAEEAILGDVMGSKDIQCGAVSFIYWNEQQTHGTPAGYGGLTVCSS
jgi:hypothetical protein